MIGATLVGRIELVARVTAHTLRGAAYVARSASEYQELEALAGLGLLKWDTNEPRGWFRAAPLRAVAQRIGVAKADPVLGFGPDLVVLECGHEEINWGSPLSRCTQCERSGDFVTPHLSWEAA